jgi:hypothetical protein
MTNTLTSLGAFALIVAVLSGCGGDGPQAGREVPAATGPAITQQLYPGGDTSALTPVPGR